MNPLASIGVLAAAWYWLSRPERNPTGAGYRDKSGKFHPIRNSEWYQPSLLSEADTTQPTLRPVPTPAVETSKTHAPETMETPATTADKLRKTAEKPAKTAEFTDTVVTDAIDMPALKGSDKQVAWARKIRAEYVSKWEEAIRRDAGRSDASQIERFRRAIAMLVKARTDASWWIDNRYEPAGHMLAPVFASA